MTNDAPAARREARRINRIRRDLLKAALSYAEKDIPVFSLVPGGKKPHGKLAPHGFKDATTDPALIKKWWAEEPDANLGIPTGQASGWVVIDTDLDFADGKDGEEAVRRLETEHGGLPQTVMQLTPRGGNHRIFKDPGGIRCSVGKLGVGVDIRADGGYVAVTPSIRPDGFYEWELDHHPDFMEPAALPNEWVRVLRGDESRESQHKGKSGTHGPILKGQRNSTLTSIGGALRREGADKKEILTALLEVNRTRCSPPLPDGEVEKIALSVCRYEQGTASTTEAKAKDLRALLDGQVAQAKASQDPGLAFNAIRLLVQLSLADRASYRAKFRDALGKKLNLNHWDNALVGGKKDADPEPESVTEQSANSITAEYHFAQDEGEHIHYYKAGRYVPRGVRLIKRLVKETMKTLGLKWTTHASKEVMRFISDDAPLLKDSPEGELNCLNGVVDLKTGVIRAHSPDDLTTFQLPVLYDQSATCPEFDRFISTILPDEDPGIIHEMAADALTTNRDDQKAILLEGSGGNGKSILLSALSAFAGPDNVSHYSLHDFENNRFATSGLLGKRFNICSDLPSTHLKTSSVFKQVTGGDFIPGEYKHGASFSFQPHVRLIFAANTAPRANDATSAFFQRWLVIKFSQDFRGTKAERPGKELLAELTTEKELSGLLNSALSALPNLLKNGFTVSAPMLDAADEFRRTTDPLALWLDANTVDDPEAWVPRADLLRPYNLDCDNVERGHMSATAFTPAIERLRPQARGAQKTVGDKPGVRVWLGIGLVASDQQGKASDSTESPQSEAATRGSRGIKHCKRSETPPGSEEGVGKAGGMKENDYCRDNPVHPVYEETLITRCHDLGLTLSPLPSGMLRVRCNDEISDSLRSALKDKKVEILAILEAMEWLKPRLSEPKRIADLISEWCGGTRVLGRDGVERWEGGREATNGHDIDALLAARWQIGVEPYLGEDDLSWWRLPTEWKH